MGRPAYTAVHTTQPVTPRSSSILMMGTKKIDGMDRTALHCADAPGGGRKVFSKRRSHPAAAPAALPYRLATMMTAAASEMRLRKKITSSRRMAVKTDQKMAAHGHYPIALHPRT